VLLIKKLVGVLTLFAKDCHEFHFLRLVLYYEIIVRLSFGTFSVFIAQFIHAIVLAL